ncbi:MAG: YbgA family protein [Bacilli bacterium]|nr:YbgA family protein [Bacilli bacterium]
MNQETKVKWNDDSDSVFQNRENIEIYTINHFEEIRIKGTLKDLLSFHASNKYLFMTFDPVLLKKLGGIVSNRVTIPRDSLFDSYEDNLKRLLQGKPSHKNRVNTISHMFGYFKKIISSFEKSELLEDLEKFARNNIDYELILRKIHDLAVRFEERYLLGQNIFLSYDKAMIERRADKTRREKEI